MLVTDKDLAGLSEIYPNGKHVTKTPVKWQGEFVWQKFATFTAKMDGKHVKGVAFYDFGDGNIVIVLDGEAAKGSSNACFFFDGKRVAITVLIDDQPEVLYNPRALTDFKLEIVPLKEPL